MTHEQLVDLIRRMTECDRMTLSELHRKLHAMYERGELDEPVSPATLVKVLIKVLEKWRRLR